MKQALLRIFGATILSLLAAEIALRLLEIKPRGKPPARNPESAYIVPDDKLGWKNRPQFSLTRTLSAGSQIRISTDDRGRRSCVVPEAANDSESKRSQRQHIAIFGCSFTAGGEFLDDNDPYPCQLQSRRSELLISNHGVDGYSTIQVLLGIRQLLGQNEPPTKILYGFVDFHELRNTASWRWLTGISNLATQPISLPFGQISSSGVFEIGEPVYALRLPLAEYSAIITRLEAFLNLVQAVRRDRFIDQVTVRAVRSMHEEASQRGVQFSVVNLLSLNRDQAFYRDQFSQAGIPVIDCAFPLMQYQPTDYTLPEDGHPNRLVHRFWAKCIAEALDKS